VQDDEGQDEDDGLRDLAGEASRCEAEEQVAGPGPQFREDVEVDEADILQLTVERVDHLKLGLGPAVSLALVVDILRHVILQHLWRLELLEDLVLAETEEAFEEKLSDGEADDELLPREEGPVEGLR
jgi:hypothetical protein